MLTVYSDSHALQHAQPAMYDGSVQPCFDIPDRAKQVLARVIGQNLGKVIVPTDHGLGPVLRIHDESYVDFLQTIWQRWEASGHTSNLIPTAFPINKSRARKKVPNSVVGAVGHYAFDTDAQITAGTWPAVYHSAQVAITAAGVVMNQRDCAFALCRPPGHHSGVDYMGGYCFLNNAAIAAQYFRDSGATKVAILDIDYHHGNGTQEIFYNRSDVLFASLHVDPLEDYPFYFGHADEKGEADGEGCNLNYPLPLGCDWASYGRTLLEALKAISNYAPDYLVVSLGVDTYERDPISHFKLSSSDYLTLGGHIASLGLPTLFVMEGGYDLNAIGVNVVNVLQGFETNR